MKFSKNNLCLLAFLACVVGGGISCSLGGNSSSEETVTELEATEGSGGEDESAGEEEGLEDEGDDFVDSDEELGDEELTDADEEFTDSSEEFTDSSEEEFTDSNEEFTDSSEEGFTDSSEGFANSEEDSGDGLDEETEGEETEVVAEEVSEFVDDSGEPEVAATPDPSVKITNIQFLADQRGGIIAITADSPVEYQDRFNQGTNQYIVDISDAFLPQHLRRPFIMKDFKSAKFGAINAYQKEGSGVISIIVQMKSDSTNPSIEQEGNVIYVVPSSGDNNTLAQDSSSEGEELIQVDQEESGTLEAETSMEPEVDEEIEESAYEETSGEDLMDSKVLGARSLEEFLMNNNKFYGKRISLALRGVNIEDAINFIAEESGANLVLSENVKGKITMKLREVPWDQALVTLLKTNGLGYVRQGNVIRISTLKQLQAESQVSKSILEAQKALLPVHVRVVPVSYAKVEKLQTQLKPFLTPKRGKVAIDARTSSIILTDTEDILDRLSALIKRLDIPPEQVMIEGKVVEATKEFSKRLGVTWGLSGAPTSLGGSGGTPLTVTPSLGIRPVSPQSILGSVSFMSLNIGSLDFLGDLDAALELAESDSTARVISSPRIVTMNKEPSRISQSGEVISISSINNNGVTTRQVNRVPVTLSLDVTPQITAAGGVIMEVDVKRQFPGALEDTETLARAINTRGAKTKVLVHHGQTAVIGGIYNTRESDGEVGTPVLKNIPVLGWLFKHKAREKRKNELLIFLTPRIMKRKM